MKIGNPTNYKENTFLTTIHTEKKFRYKSCIFFEYYFL